MAPRDFTVDFDEAYSMLLTQMYLDRQEVDYESSDGQEYGDEAPMPMMPMHRKSKSASVVLPPPLNIVKDDLKRSSLPAPAPPALPSPPLPPGRYRYKPLRSKDDIRLISLSTSEVDDELYFQLTRQNRNDCPAYDAVSYTWGSTARTKTIYHAFNGSALPVTENCEAALRALHRKDSNKLFWLDALSINQDDIEERSHQVSIMDDVFRNAAQTTVYLGQADEHTLALSRWPYIRGLTQGYDKATHERATEKAFAHVEALLKRPWFKRTWIIQEVLLSKHLHLQAGDQMLDFSEICQLLQCHGCGRRKEVGIMDTYIRYGTEFDTRTRHAHRLAWAGPRSVSWRISALQSAVPSKGYLQYWQLFKLLLETATYQCRDPRDKLYALISLFDGDPPSELRPDYSLSVEEVFANISRYLIYSENMTLPLSAAHGVTVSRSLPSWAIDWRAAPTIESLLHNELGDRTQYQAGMKLGHQHIPALPSGGNTLRLRGVRVASIHLKLLHPAKKDDHSPLLGDEPRQLKELVWYTRKGFHPASTTSACYLPAKTWPLDVVCVFIGFEVPFVLRELDKTWQLVGECDVEEIMYGQALAGIDWRQVDAPDPVWPLEDFILV